MSNKNRKRFLTVSDWQNYLQDALAKGQIEGSEINALRQNCYKDIEEARQRPLLIYAVKFPEAPREAPISIDQGDIDGFTDLVEAVPETVDKVDVLIHSPGGSPEATERIVSLLRSRFHDVSFLIPHSAYSAATMLALSGNEILLHPSATLGPIDPQINGIPARSIRRGFENVRELLQKEGPEALPAYIPLIEKYSLELLEICNDYEELSKELVTDWLKTYMFAGEPDKNSTIDEAVKFFSTYDNHKTHSRALTFDKLQKLNLKIKLADTGLRPLMREAHILLSGFFGITPFVKLYENSQGLSWGKQFQQITVNAPMQQIPAQQR
jgi:ClpP class serine protease